MKELANIHLEITIDDFINKKIIEYQELKDIKMVVVHTGIFHLDDIVLNIFMRLVNSDYILKRVREVENEWLEDKNIMVADIGRKYEPEKNNFDHHQGLQNEMALSLFLKKYWKVYFVNEFAYNLFKKKFLDFSAKYDNGDINPANYSEYPILQRYINYFNFLDTEDKTNDKSFEIATKYFAVLIYKELEKINNLAVNYDKFKNYIIEGTKVAIGEYIQGWQELAPEVDVKVFITYDKNRKQYNITSWNTDDLKFGTWIKENLEYELNIKDKIFLHKAGFLMAIPEEYFDKEKVIDIINYYIDVYNNTLL